MYANFTSTTAPSVVPLTAKSSFLNTIGADAFVILIAVGFAILIGIVAIYLSYCDSSAKDQKLYAINHPDEVRNTMHDFGLM